MRYLSLAEVVELHRRLLQVTSGAPGIRDFISDLTRNRCCPTPVSAAAEGRRLDAEVMRIEAEPTGEPEMS